VTHCLSKSCGSFTGCRKDDADDDELNVVSRLEPRAWHFSLQSFTIICEGGRERHAENSVLTVERPKICFFEKEFKKFTRVPVYHYV
jgi:hypothetical protein